MNEPNATDYDPADYPLMTCRQVADYLGVCTHTVTRYTAQGLLKPIRFNSRLIRYRPSDVKRLVDGARVTPAPQRSAARP